MKVLLLLLILAVPVSEPEEKFIPPNLEHAMVIACAVGGGDDGQADAFVFVKYSDGTKFTPTIAVHPDAWSSVEECVRWFKDLKPALKEAEERKEEKRQ